LDPEDEKYEDADGKDDRKRSDSPASSTDEFQLVPDDTGVDEQTEVNLEMDTALKEVDSEVPIGRFKDESKMEEATEVRRRTVTTSTQSGS